MVLIAVQSHIYLRRLSTIIHRQVKVFRWGFVRPVNVEYVAKPVVGRDFHIIQSVADFR